MMLLAVEQIEQMQIQFWFFPLMFLLPALWFLVGILILFWVYRDAESRGMDGVLWAIVVFFLNIIGLVLYLLVRDSPRGGLLGKRITRVCPKCGQVLDDEAKFCSRCGNPLE